MAVNGYAAAQDIVDINSGVSALAEAMGSRVNSNEASIVALAASFPQVEEQVEAAVNAAIAATQAVEGRLDKTAGLSDLEDKAAGFDNLVTSSDAAGFVPSSPNLILEKAPVDLMDMLSNVQRQDVRDGTNTGDYAPYLQSQINVMIADRRNGTLPETPEALRLETPVVASFPERGTSSMVSSFEMIGRGMKNSVFVSYVAGGPSLTVTHDLAGSAELGGEGYVTSGYVEGLRLRGFGIRSALGVASGGIKIENAVNPIIEAIEVFGFHGKGLEIAAFADPDIDTTSMPTIRGCRLQGNDYGLYIAAQSSGALALSQGLVENNWMLGNRKDGIYASGFDQLRLLYNAIQANGTNGGANDYGGMHVANFGVTPRNLFCMGNEWGNGNRAYNLKIDGLAGGQSLMDRWVTNSSEFDYPTPVSVILGDGTSVVRNFDIAHPQIVAHPSVPHVLVSPASNVTASSNISIRSPDYLQWGAPGQALTNNPSKVAVLEAVIGAKPVRPRDQTQQLKVVDSAAPYQPDLDIANYYRLYVATPVVTILSILGGDGIRSGEEITFVIENLTAGDIDIIWPANLLAPDLVLPSAGEAMIASFKYHSALGKFYPLSYGAKITL